MSNLDHSLGLLDLIQKPLYQQDSAILITGATGFLGGHYLYWKLHTPGKVFVLVRGEDQHQAEKRVRENLAQCAKSYNLNDIPESVLKQKLVCVQGNLKHCSLGLDTQQIQQLQQAAISEIWHFAASLSFRWEEKDKIDATNIYGTHQLLRLASKLNIQRFVYISTAYTAGKQNGNITETLHSLSGEFTNYYEQSKCAAEHLVNEATREAGIALTIVRPAIIIGPELTQLSGGTRFGLYGFFKEIQQLREPLSQVKCKIRLVGDPNAIGNFIPVDQVVLDLLYLKSIQFGDQQIYHAVNSCNIKIFDVIKQCEHLNQLDCLDIVEARTGTVSSFERLFDSKTQFYEGYYSSVKLFQRSLPAHPPMTLEKISHFMRFFADELNAENCGDIFQRHQLASWDQVMLTLHTLGNSKAPPLIIANAYGMPVDLIAPLAQRLSKTHFVITWDTRWVPALTQDFEPDKCHSLTHAKDIIAIMDYFQLSIASVLGWSSGVQSCLRVMQAFPQRIATGILLNGGVSLKEDGLAISSFEENIKSLLPKISANRRMAEFYCQLIYGNVNADASDDKAIASVLSSTDPHLLLMTSMPYRNSESLFRYANMMHTLFNEQDDAFTTGITTPVLVIGCSDDAVTHPELAKALAKRLIHSELMMIKKAGHFAHYYDPQLATLITDYMDRHQPTSKETSSLCQSLLTD